MGFQVAASKPDPVNWAVKPCIQSHNWI